MKILILGTSLFPDRLTVNKALAANADKARIDTIDLEDIDADDEAAWSGVARAILDADLVVTN